MILAKIILVKNRANDQRWKILKLLADIEIILLIGIYAQRFYLPIPAKQPLKSLLLKNGVTTFLNTGFCHIPAGITIIC